METQNYEGYTIKTAGFEGPFGLLLHLIEKRKLFINDVSLSAVTEEYLSYINKLGGLSGSSELHPRDISNFILVASTLLLIKSKSLLPNLDLTSEEEGNIHNLEERLRLYEIFSRLSLNVKNNFGKNIIFAPLPRKNDFLVFLPDDQITKDSMMTLASQLLNAMPKRTPISEVEVKKVISLEEMIDRLTNRVQTALKMSFRKDFGGSKVEVIVGFLAMLELVREGILDAIQEEGTGDIIISKQVLVASD